MASRWGNNGNSDRLHFLSSKITADGDCSYETETCSLLGRKAMTNLDNILKGRDISLPTKVHIVKAVIFPLVMYGRDNWTMKKAECQRIDAFDLWCCRRFLRHPLTARRSNHSILKKSVLNIYWKVDAEAPILWPPDAKSWLTRKDPDAKKGWKQEEKGITEDKMVGRHHQLNGHEFEQYQEMVKDREVGVLQSMGSQRVRHD